MAVPGRPFPSVVAGGVGWTWELRRSTAKKGSDGGAYGASSFASPEVEPGIPPEGGRFPLGDVGEGIMPAGYAERTGREETAASRAGGWRRRMQGGC